MFILTGSKIWLCYEGVYFFWNKVYLPLLFDLIFCPPFGFSWENGGPSQKGLFLLVDLLTSAIAWLECFFAFRLSIRWSLKSFPKSTWLCFCRNAAFSLSIEATCDEEVHVLAHSIGKSHVLLVTVELICLLFLNKLFFNFVPIPNKSLRFTRFRRSYVNRTAIVLTNHCQSYTAFLLDVLCWKWSRSFFAAVCPQWQCICVTCFCWAHMLLECC